MGSKTGSLVEAKRLELQEHVGKLRNDLETSRFDARYTEAEKKLVGEAIAGALANISLQLQRIENRHVSDVAPTRPYCQEIREAKVRKVPQKFIRRGFVIRNFDKLTGALEIFIPDGYPISELLGQEFSLPDGNKITTGELVVSLPEQIRDDKKIYYSVGLQVASGVPWSMLSTQVILLDTATEPTKEEVRSFFDNSRDEYLSRMKQDHDKIMEYMFRPYKRPELGSPGGIFPLMKTDSKAVQHHSPEFFMGVDTYDEKNLSYCLARRFGGGIEVILSKTVHDRPSFDEQVENLAKYFNATKVEERK